MAYYLVAYFGRIDTVETFLRCRNSGCRMTSVVAEQSVHKVFKDISEAVTAAAQSWPTQDVMDVDKP